MASKPGILTEWPWKPLGSYKVSFVYIMLAIYTHIYLNNDYLINYFRISIIIIIN